MSLSRAVEFVKFCENRLGYVPNRHHSALGKARTSDAKKLMLKMAEKPELYTWDNLELAVELLFRQRQPISSPVFAAYRVEEALRLANAVEPERPIGDLIDEAIAVEQAQRPSQEHDWVGVLTRAVGRYRVETYAEWKAERGHLLLVGAR